MAEEQGFLLVVFCPPARANVEGSPTAQGRTPSVKLMPRHPRCNVIMARVAASESSWQHALTATSARHRVVAVVVALLGAEKARQIRRPEVQPAAPFDGDVAEAPSRCLGIAAQPAGEFLQRDQIVIVLRG
jgi:hypothetical protein